MNGHGQATDGLVFDLNAKRESNEFLSGPTWMDGIHLI